MTALTPLLRKALLQSQFSKGFPNALQLQGSAVPEQGGQKLDHLASLLLEDDMPSILNDQELDSCNKILQELQDLVCPDTPLGFASSGEKELAFASHSDQLLAYANTFESSNISDNYSLSGTALQQVVHRLNLQNIELIEMLLRCGSLISTGHLTEAMPMIQTLIQQASPTGNATQRLVYAFVESLVARIYGPSPDVKCIRLSLEKKLRTFKFVTEVLPICRLLYFFPNQAILKACEGFNRIHVVDYGGSQGYGFQWPSLIRDFGARLGGPFEMRLTLVDSPAHGAAIKRTDEISTRLTRYAMSKGVNLKVHAIEDRWEHVQASDLNLRAEEVLIVNSIADNQHLREESLIPESPRKHWIKRVARMKPTLFTIAIQNMAGTAPFFMNRLVDILPYYATQYDMLETCMGDSAEREMFEQFTFARQIVNVVGYEGMGRIERHETYNCWHNRLMDEGFQVLPPSLNTFRRGNDILEPFQKPFSLGTDQGWVLLGWKGHTTHAISAWNM